MFRKCLNIRKCERTWELSCERILDKYKVFDKSIERILMSQKKKKKRIPGINLWAPIKEHYSWISNQWSSLVSFTFKYFLRILNECLQTKFSIWIEKKKHGRRFLLVEIHWKIERRNEMLKIWVPKLQRKQYAVHVNYDFVSWFVCGECVRADWCTESLFKPAIKSDFFLLSGYY